MRTEDKTEFTTLLVSAMALYDKQITKPVADIFFNALGPYSLAQVRDGLSRHLQDPVDGKFSPKPADVIRQMQGVIADDRRPGKDRAWSIALRSLDEGETVVLTPEILAAREVARPLLEIRDKFAARMAFVEVYEQLVAQARREGRTIDVIVSLGGDKDRRQFAIEDGLRSGLLTQDQAAPHLLRIGQETQPVSADGSALAGLLAAPAGGKPLDDAENQERWRALRRGLGSGAREVQAEKSMAEALEKRADTQRRKDELFDMAEFKKWHPVEDDDGE